ncbi:MAG: hypothetical protein AAB336_09825, partial [Acidobacteriota bacterium]
MKFSKLIIAIIFTIIFVFNSFASDFTKAEADKVYQLLENSDSRGTFEYLADLFERNGANVFIGAKSYPALQLELKDLTEVINDYNAMYKTISVSRMPKLEEGKIYWENWSKVLAKDNFKQDKFFRDDRERFLMANYNSLVLMLHEYGHSFDDRYDFNNFSSANPLNCGEYFADKFAIAVINHLSQDERFAKLRTRYLELIKSFDESIPSENRFKNVNYEDLKGDCGAIKMDGTGLNPDGSLNYNFFRRYASAYFNRHQLMLADVKYPKLAELIENELTKPFESKKYQNSAEKVLVQTTKEIKTNFILKDFDSDFAEILRKEPNSPKLNQDSQTRSAVSHKGEVLHARTMFTGKAAVWENLTVEILDAEQQNVKEKISIKLPKDFQKYSYFHSFLPLNDNAILLFFGDYKQGNSATYCYNSFAKAEKQNGIWQVKFSKKDALKDVCSRNADSNIFATPNGKVKFILPTADGKQFSNVASDDVKETAMNEYSLDLGKLTVKKDGVRINFDSGMNLYNTSLFGNDNGRVFVTSYNLIYELKDQTPFLIGNKLK